MDNIENNPQNHLVDFLKRPLPPPSLGVDSDFERVGEATPSTKLDWLSGGGEIAALIRAKDWSQTPLGPLETWPQSLRTTVSLCLASNFPINIIWGPEATQIYNLGYKALCGNAHPAAIGQSYRLMWASAWSAIGEPFEKARLGETTFLENQRMFFLRNGYLEETFFTFSISPIRDESGAVVGLFNPVTETTATMLNQRRTRLLRDITSETANSDSIAEASLRIARTLSDYASDIPSAILFLENEMGDLEVAATTGDVAGLTDLSLWPIAEVTANLQPFFIDTIREKIVNRSCLMPIKAQGYSKPIGFIAVTLSACLPLNEAYMAFLDMLGNAISGVVSNALMNESLESERTDLQSDKDAAEAATRSKSAFLANMSHEIRTPLAAILGFSEILKSHDLKIEDRDKYLNIITRNGNSLVKIIDDILDLSKIEAGKIQIEKEPLVLPDLIRDVITMFSDRAVGKGLTLHFDPTSLPDFKIQGDEVRIRQILVNLIGNAIKFTSAGSVTIGGNFNSVDESNIEILLRVSDTGIGITQEQGEILFQDFTQADNKTTRHFGGTGLGLALSKKLAKAMGGDVTIEQNAAGLRGTTFLVRLVTAIAQPVLEEIAPLVTPSSKTVLKRLNGWKILVVDDAPDNRLLMKVLLGREGAILHEAASGEEAILKAHEFSYDLILMDIQMPGLDGYQALAKLRSENYRRPIFALTAHSMKEEKDRALAAGFSGHISKPVDPTTVVETLLAHARKIH